MKNKWLIVASFLLLLFSSFSYAARLHFPRGCRPVGFTFENGNLVLQPETDEMMSDIQTVYFVHNLSRYKIELTGISRETFSPDYLNELFALQWSALAVDQKITEFSCRISQENRVGPRIDCGRFVEICQYPHAKFSEHNRGTYWVTDSDTLERAVEGAIDKGILLKS